MNRPMHTLAPIALALLACACTTTAEVAWDVRISDPSLSERTAVIETSVRRGGCDGVLVYRAAIARGRSGPPPMLGRGLHGFSAEARDASCAPIGRACIERDLPLPAGARVELVLEPFTGPAACSATRCIAGECAEDDAGPDPEIDASIPELDAGDDPVDAALPDSGGDVDASFPEPDAGPPIETDAGTAPCDGVSWSTRCYVLRSETSEWSAAEATCVSWGGHLTSLGGPEEEAFVRGLAGSTVYWIGLNDLAAEGAWEWIDGSASSHRDWLGGAPANREQNDCVSDDPGSGWSVGRCRETHAFACER